MGHNNRWGDCSAIRGSSCSRSGFSWDYSIYSVYKLEHPKTDSAISFPKEPSVACDHKARNVQNSEYMEFQAGKSYPFKLDRRVAARTDSTGLDGWEKFGLECKEMKDAPAALLPPAKYAVEMKMKTYPALLTLPGSSGPYKFKFRTNEAVVKQDADVADGIADTFGTACTRGALTGAGGGSGMPGGQSSAAAEIISGGTGFEGGAGTLSTDAACGLGYAKADGTFMQLSLTSTEYTLETYPHLHMCYRIAPGASVNMVVTARVRGRDQEFSIGMTQDTKHFHHNRKRAAQWPIKSDKEGKTSGQWDCISINLFAQVQDYDSYERRFWGLDYRNPSRAVPELRKMKIKRIALRSGLWKHDYHGSTRKYWSYTALGGGDVSIDELRWSSVPLSVSTVSPSPFLGIGV